MKRVLSLLAFALLIAAPLQSNLSQFTGSINNRDHWDFTAFPVTYQINPKRSANMIGTADAGSAVDAAFATWLTAPNATLSASRGPDTTSTSHGSDGQNLICFVCQADFSKDASTLAVTLTTTADGAGGSDLHGGSTRFAGQIIDADLIFNPAVCFSTDVAGKCSNGKDSEDLQTVATHEIGHFFGLDHSAIVRAVMFPFSPPVQHVLSLDDVAGISTTYPKPAPDFATGSISGSVNFASGGGVLGAHVFAESQTGGPGLPSTIRNSPVGTLSINTGAYTITGLPADNYLVAAEPLNEPVTNDNVTGYAKLFGATSVNTGFNTTFH
jgi:hypothetical protein